jgi:hypothetical protein
MPGKKTIPERFSIGDSVRVKAGVADPDYPDIPIGGWSGQITEIQAGDPPTCLVRWSQQTLENMHPVYRNRCERDGLDIKNMWLALSEIEPNADQRAEMEQPTAIQTKPLNMKDEDDRIRAVFGFTHDGLIPDVSEDTLRIYRDYLAEKLSFPFEAEGKLNPRRFCSRRQTVTVVAAIPGELTKLAFHRVFGDFDLLAFRDPRQSRRSTWRTGSEAA